jgi:hypothetical protein
MPEAGCPGPPEHPATSCQGGCRDHQIKAGQHPWHSAITQAELQAPDNGWLITLGWLITILMAMRQSPVKRQISAKGE